jgi:hypothetical protein
MLTALDTALHSDASMNITGPSVRSYPGMSIGSGLREILAGECALFEATFAS